MAAREILEHVISFVEQWAEFYFQQRYFGNRNLNTRSESYLQEKTDSYLYPFLDASASAISPELYKPCSDPHIHEMVLYLERKKQTMHKFIGRTARYCSYFLFGQNRIACISLNQTSQLCTGRHVVRNEKSWRAKLSGHTSSQVASLQLDKQVGFGFPLF